MATIALSPIPPIPSPGDRDFETKIGKVLSHMPTLATELKTIAETVVESATLVDVEGNATVAATAASQASLSAGSAVAAAGTAATQANAAKAEATKAARSKSDAALAASQSGTNAVAAFEAAGRAEAAVLAAEAIAATKAEEVATQAAADAATQAVSGVIAQAQASADAAALSAADANTAKNAAQTAATTAGQSVAAIATHAQTAQTASTAASSHAHNAGLRAAESLASAQQATSAGQAATAGAAQVLEILDNLTTGPVVSVNGKYGAVNLVPGDVGAAPDAHVGATGTAHGIVTTSVAGFMSAADKTKLDGVATNANNYAHPTGDGNLHVPATGTTNAGKVLTAGSTAGSLIWATPLALGSSAGTAAGTAAAGTATTAARSDHVHPVQTSVSGNAGTATKLATARTIGMTGDVTWTSAAFDGSGSVTGAATLAASGATAGTYKSVTVDAKGRVTAGTNPTTLADYGISDAASSTHNHTLDALSNVTITSNAAGEVLKWDGSKWVNNTLAEAGIQPAIAAGTTAQYWRGDKTWRDLFTDVRAATLTGLSTATSAVVSATDTVLGALGKLQKQVSDNLTTLTSHTGSTSNPHGVTKAQVGLGDVDNTSDANKPLSTAAQTALNLKANIATTVEQTDIGTAPNEIPLNQHLGGMAFQSPESVVIRPAASANPQQVGALVFQLTNDTTLVVKVKGSDGTVRSATLTLA